MSEEEEPVYNYVMDSRKVRVRERVRLAWCIVAGIPVVYRAKKNPDHYRAEWWDRTPVSLPKGASVGDFDDVERP